MGWAFGTGKHPRTFKKRRIGYGVSAKCDEPRCGKKIDRGLAYLCGGLYGNDGIGCGGYFCGDHLFYVYRERRTAPDDDSGYRCPSCKRADEARGTGA
jgi:hypothetical protein